MALWTAFSIGLLGSLHCVGMCGPIALSLPYSGQNKWARLFRILLYHFGRIFTYATLGLLIGLFGQGMLWAGIQSQLSIALGLLLLFAALFSINIESRLLRFSPIAKANIWVKLRIASILGNPNLTSFVFLGLLNGLLPCGLVYMGIFGALSSETLWLSAAYMILFGLGTLPLMLATSLAGQFIKAQWRNSIRKLVPVFLLVFALLLLIRGLNFELPSDFFFRSNWQNVPLCQ